jgi:hypothetical protein
MQAWWTETTGLRAVHKAEGDLQTIAVGPRAVLPLWCRHRGVWIRRHVEQRCPTTSHRLIWRGVDGRPTVRRQQPIDWYVPG